MSAQAVSLPVGSKPISPEIATAASVLVAVEPAGSPVASSAPAVVIRAVQALDTTVTAEPTVIDTVTAEPTVIHTVTAVPTVDPIVTAETTVIYTVMATVSVEPSASVVLPVPEPPNNVLAPEPIRVPSVVYYPPPPVPDFTDNSAEHTPASNEMYVSGDQTPLYC